KLSVRSQRNGGETPLQSVGADVSDTIFFTGGDPSGFPVEISMLVQTYLSGEMAEMDAFMGMNIQSTDGSQVGGFAAGIVTRTEDGRALVQIAADWAEGWTVLDGGVEEVSVTPDGMLTRVS